MSIETLLQAAEYLDRREREMEHGYASTLPMPEDYELSNIKSPSNTAKKSQGTRSTHNELEKNRRAHLRHCLERLKDIVPVGSESSRHTTLGLLTKAKAFIRALEEKERKQKTIKDQLVQDKMRLKHRYEMLKSMSYRNSRNERTISECSSSTISTSSTASTSNDDNDDVDIINSDSDDSSTSGSDGGMVVTTKKLSLMDSL